MRMYGNSINTFRRDKEEYDCVHEMHEHLAENSRRNGLFRTVELYAGMMLLSKKNIEDCRENGVILAYQKSSRTATDVYCDICDFVTDWIVGRTFLVNNKLVNEFYDPENDKSYANRSFIYNDPIKFGNVYGNESMLLIKNVEIFYKFMRKRHYAAVQKRT